MLLPRFLFFGEKGGRHLFCSRPPLPRYHRVDTSGLHPKQSVIEACGSMSRVARSRFHPASSHCDGPDTLEVVDSNRPRGRANWMDITRLPLLNRHEAALFYPFHRNVDPQRVPLSGCPCKACFNRHTGVRYLHFPFTSYHEAGHSSWPCLVVPSVYTLVLPRRRQSGCTASAQTTQRPGQPPYRQESHPSPDTWQRHTSGHDRCCPE